VIVWLDAQLSPAIAPWLSSTFSIEAHAVRDLGLRDSDDPAIFDAAKAANVVVFTKDSDFVELVERRGAPPQVVWIRCGNTSNAKLREVLTSEWTRLVERLDAGDVLVEVGAEK
jgi:predicted nuclease of predicted toxin-antitoxin system